MRAANPYRHIANLTDQNHHSEALIAGAAVLGARKLEEQFKLIAKLREIEGHMPSSLGQYRDELYEELMELAKSRLGPERFKLFYEAF